MRKPKNIKNVLAVQTALRAFHALLPDEEAFVLAELCLVKDPVAYEKKLEAFKEASLAGFADGMIDGEIFLLKDAPPKPIDNSWWGPSPDPVLPAPKTGRTSATPAGRGRRSGSGRERP